MCLEIRREVAGLALNQSPLLIVVKEKMSRHVKKRGNRECKMIFQFLVIAMILINAFTVREVV